MLNQSTDAISNRNGAKAGAADISSSFIKAMTSEAEAMDLDNDEGISFDNQSMASSSNAPSFNGSKIFVKNKPKAQPMVLKGSQKL